MSETSEARYGAPGGPIPGSRLVRAYCYCCRAPMRVLPEDARNAARGWCSCDRCAGMRNYGRSASRDPVAVDLAYHGEGLSGEHSIG